MPFLRKTSMRLPSKMRFISAQLNALLENGAELALSNARHANSLAKMLYEGVLELAHDNPSISLPNQTEANAVFPIFPESVTAKLQEHYRFYIWNQATGQVRWMCGWDNSEDDVRSILAALKDAL